jgi:hypothetical protein
MQPTIGLLVLDRPRLGGIDFVPGAVENPRAHEADHAASDGVDSDDRVQEQTKVAVIAGTSEAAFAGNVTREVELGGVLDRRHVPSSRAPASEAPRGGQHLAIADRAVIKKATKTKRFVAVFRQGMYAGRGPLAHRSQQTRANAALTRITEATKIFLNHANRVPPTPAETKSQIESCRNRFALVRLP